MDDTNIHTTEQISKKRGLFALSPLLLLLLLCLLYAFLDNSHNIPLASFLIISIVYAIATTKQPKLFKDRVKVLSKGTLNIDIITMIWIFLLAGVFSATSKDIGAMESLAELMTRLFPGKFFLCGVFFAACTISFVTGTSMGTVFIFMPMISQISTHPNLNMAVVGAAVCSGSFFGDNLSLISDTTIAAVQTLECDSKKKFYDNLRIVLPAVIISFIIYYLICPIDIQFHPAISSINLVLLFPFLLVLLLSIIGMNVFSVLFIGICSNFIVGWLATKNGLRMFIGHFLQTTTIGAVGMGELIILTFLCSGLLALIKHNGGLDIIVNRMSQFKNEKWSEFSAAFLVSFVNVCTINNTVAVLTTGPIVKNLTSHLSIKDYRMASIIDIFACITQGLIPFGAQVLFAAKEVNASVFSVILHSYFLFALILSSANAIIFGKLYHKKQIVS